MPSPRLRVRRLRQDRITAAHWIVLGREPMSLREPWGAAWRRAHDVGTVESILGEMTQVWEAVKANLLGHWIRNRPGSRPWMWWMVDAPEKHRRILSGPGFRVLDGPDCVLKRTCVRFGVCRCYGKPEEWENVCESEYVYLSRLGLLTAAEKSIPAGEFPRTNREENLDLRDDGSWLPLNLT